MIFIYSCVQKILSLNTCTNTHHLQNQIWQLLKGLYITLSNLFMLEKNNNQLTGISGDVWLVVPSAEATM